jgi:hypothetical protein
MKRGLVPALLLTTLICSNCRSPGGLYGADSIMLFDKKDGSAPIYSANGQLDFAGQNPDEKAKKVMAVACPNGAPQLLASSANPLKTETTTFLLWTAFFTCNDAIPGAK